MHGAVDLLVRLSICLSPRSVRECDFLKKLSSLELLTTYRKSHMGLFKARIIESIKFKMADAAISKIVFLP